MQALWVLLCIFIYVLLLLCKVPRHVLVNISEQVRQGRLAYFLRCRERLNNLHIASMPEPYDPHLLLSSGHCMNGKEIKGEEDLHSPELLMMVSTWPTWRCNTHAQPYSQQAYRCGSSHSNPAACY